MHISNILFRFIAKLNDDISNNFVTVLPAATLMRHLDAMQRKYDRTQMKLQQMQNEKGEPLLTIIIISLNIKIKYKNYAKN